MLLEKLIHTSLNNKESKQTRGNEALIFKIFEETSSNDLAFSTLDIFH